MSKVEQNLSSQLEGTDQRANFFFFFFFFFYFIFKKTLFEKLQYLKQDLKSKLALNWLYKVHDAPDFLSSRTLV